MKIVYTSRASLNGVRVCFVAVCVRACVHLCLFFAVLSHIEKIICVFVPFLPKTVD